MTVIFNCSSKSDVRIKNIGRDANEYDFSIFAKNLGYEIHVDGQDLILKSNEIETKRRKALSFSNLLPVNNPRLIAESVLNGLSIPFEGKYREPMPKLNHYEEYGVVAELFKKQYEFLACPKHQLSSYITDDLLPFLKSKFNVESAIVCSLDADYAQAAISFFKFVYLTDSVGKEQARVHVEQQRTTDGIVPMSLDYQKYVNSVLVSLPASTIIEFERPGLIIYFTKENPWLFPYIATANLFDHLARSSDPVLGKHADLRLLGEMLHGKANEKYVQVWPWSRNKISRCEDNRGQTTIS